MSIRKVDARTVLLAAVSAAALSIPGIAQAQDAAAAADATVGQEDEILVTGIRASQARAIDVKREADSVVDAISAEDIGKLPDRTISDSLQRIPGIQIRRDAGEGGQINIRGLPQVTTLLNGEEFLGANSVTTVQPNFTDIPSQLFAGATVFKSPTASLQQGGLSGTVDLLTRRPFSLPNGLTVAAAAEAQYGDKTKKWNPSFNGLVAYNSGRFGILVSAAYSKVDLSNSYNGIQSYGVGLSEEGLDLEQQALGSQGDFAVGNNGVSRGTPVRNAAGTITGFDMNGDGDADDAFITAQSHTVWNRITSRERFGGNISLQFELSDTLKLTADAFYTKQTQYDRTAGFQFQNVDWMSSPYRPTKSRNTGALSAPIGKKDFGPRRYNIHTVQTYEYDMPNFDSYSETFRIKSESQNYNLQLDFDNGEGLKASLRGIYGKAERELDQSYLQFNLTDGVQWAYSGVGNYPASLGGDRAFNPGGYRVYSQKATLDYSSGALAFTFPTNFLNQAKNLSHYALKTISSEGNDSRKGDIWTIRGDVEWKSDSGIGISAGARYSERSAEQFVFERVSPYYVGNTDHPGNPAAGCFVKWKAFDVNLGNSSCAVRDAAGNAYTAGFVRPGTDPIFGGLVKQYAMPAAGAPNIWVLDPRAMDDAEAFQNKFYPGNKNNVNPADSFDMNLRQIAGYVQVNGEGEVFGLPFRANGGVRVVNTKFRVRQNIVGVPQAYGVSGVDAGDLYTNREFTDFLPAFNASFDLSDKLKFRVSYAKTMTLLDFLQWGGGLNVGYAIDTTVNPPIFRAQSAQQRGNPNLDPWRSSNVEASLELYTGQSSMLAAGAFYLSVDSFIVNTTILRNDIPDNDGVVRNTALPVSTITQGAGGTLKGLEFSARQALTDYGVDGFFGGFGIDANYTLSLGDAGGVDLAGNKQPFQDNSKHQVNAALWYESGPFSARIAYNYRSKRLQTQNWSGIAGLSVYQRPTNYFDASISFDVTDNFTIYGQASNLTGEHERYYLTWEDQVGWDQIYERRFVAGVRAKF
ncbi:TonB-dependent receptor [Sphingomonas koreensis]|uniref:TonB-dependent receptor n=1 Tax=Sphingomonas koreensis TaxID=93064 RepID=UPI00083796CD|nr:TonB-dependent receptor [Sphingomonas koreensis]PJI88392.1 TonB-dependent receptor [Sphingomonas koreensis]RSU58683.1 TonB-dependent receptor [Sphingomonas koreensis]RSU66848.1 TonB-dependent receptor [Sphingomonas koreensis]